MYIQTKAKIRAKLFSPVVVLFLYSALLIVIMYFHEPWFDEAQSWLIARDASLQDIIFTIPHYEGHPPFWWLLLAIPAKTGLPYEISIKAINWFFSTLAVFLLLFKSPFPKWIKLVLPFTYFLFYQYGVQSRPYSILVCAVFLVAMNWDKRDEKPYKFCLSLMLLCLTSAYGIIIAGGISMAWTYELIKEKKLLTDTHRIVGLFALLLLALVLIYLMLPYSDTYANSRVLFSKPNTVWQRLYYAFFCLPSEAAVTSFGSDTLFHYFTPNVTQTVIMSVISLLIWIALFLQTGSGKTRLYLVLPSALFLAFSAIKYFYLHHVGILFLIFQFSVWISWRKEDKTDVLPMIRKHRRWLPVPLAVILLINCSWSIEASIHEIQSRFSAGKALASYVISNHLLGYRWSAYWVKEIEEENGDIVYENTHEVNGAVIEANPYLEKPLLGDALSGKSYADHILPSDEMMQNEKKALVERGTDIAIGVPAGDEQGMLFGSTEGKKILASIESEYIWKNQSRWDLLFICGKKEIADQINAAGEEK